MKKVTTTIVLVILVLLISACKPQPTPKTIDIVGDSITAQSYWGRGDQFRAGYPEGSDIVIDAWLGYKFSTVQERQTERVMEESRPEIFVLALGSNNAYSWDSTDEADFDKLLNTPHPDACVVVSLPAVAPHAQPSLVSGVAKARVYMTVSSLARPNTVIVDWAPIIKAHPEYLSGPGLHLASDKALPGRKANEEAADAYAENLWSGVDRCP